MKKTFALFGLGVNSTHPENHKKGAAKYIESRFFKNVAMRMP